MKFYLLSPASVPMNQILFPSFIKPWEDRGHSFVGNIEECDVVLFDLHARISEYKKEDYDYIIANNHKVVSFDEWDRGNMSDDQWPYPLTNQQELILSYGDVLCNFCRLLNKKRQYPRNVYPIEKGYFYEEEMLSADELFDRPYDICYLANQAPSRDSIAATLLADERLKCYVSIGATKIPFADFIKQHKKAKLFISSGAGGYTDERVQSMFSIAGIIRERSNQLLLHDFVDGVNCLRIDCPPTREDLNAIVEVVNNKDRLYDIYKSGYDFVKTYYNPDYIANFILDTIENNL